MIGLSPNDAGQQIQFLLAGVPVAQVRKDMRNILILIGQIKTNHVEGLDTFHAVVEATVQRSRPVNPHLASVLAFIPLTLAVFWGSSANTLIGGTAVGTALILVFLPALYSIWFRVEVTPSLSRNKEALLSQS